MSKRKPENYVANRRILKTTLKMILENTDWDTLEVSSEQMRQFSKLIYFMGLRLI